MLKYFEELDPRFKVFKRPENRQKGANACRNFRFEQSRGEYINWFDSDDLMERNFLETKITSFGEHIDIVLSKTKIYYTIERKVHYEKRTQLTSNVLEDFITRKISWYLPDPMYLKAFLEEYQVKFDEKLLGGQDRDFFQRVLLFDPKMFVLSDYSTTYVKHGSSISDKIYKEGDFEITQSRVRALISYIKMLNIRVGCLIISSFFTLMNCVK